MIKMKRDMQRSERILNYLYWNGDLRKEDFLEKAVRGRKKKDELNRIGAALSRLIKLGKVIRGDDGIYRLPKHEHSVEVDKPKEEEREDKKPIKIGVAIDMRLFYKACDALNISRKPYKYAVEHILRYAVERAAFEGAEISKMIEPLKTEPEPETKQPEAKLEFNLEQLKRAGLEIRSIKIDKIGM